jgi:short subunit dehydrogenase-like uncharacterized protein
LPKIAVNKRLFRKNYMKKPTYDLIIFGATSFVGQILCRYLLAEFGTPTHPGARALRWAIAGRSLEKLTILRSALGTNAATLDIIVADAADDTALRAMCMRTKVVVSTVGPYALYGEPLVRACVATGTDYCDLTGEAQWMRRMIATYEMEAIKSGARIVHTCGFDSIPSDMGVWFLQSQSMLHYGEPCTTIKMRVKAMRGAASGGTVASLINVVREASKDANLRRELANPYSLLVGRLDEKSSMKVRQTNLKNAAFDNDYKAWSAPFIMAAINVRVVLRSHALSQPSQPAVALKYDEAMLTGRGLKGRSMALAVTAGLGGLLVGAALPPTRWLLEKFVLPAPGEGPSASAQEKGFFDLRFLGTTTDNRTLSIKVTGDRDPGYGSTAKMLGEAAATLALDCNVAGGFWTPSTALGVALHARLEKHAGLQFKLLEE